MTATATPSRAEFTITGTLARITAPPNGLAAYLLRRLSVGSGQSEPWFLLDDRLLRDSGASPFDAQIARLRARWGAAEAAETDAIANQGLSPSQFMHCMKRGCYR